MLDKYCLDLLSGSKEPEGELVERIHIMDKARRKVIPNESSAINLMAQCYERLTELGWKSIIYCPKDGAVFDSVDAGCSAIGKTMYVGEWPNGVWLTYDGGDLWPCHPILFKK